MKRVLFSILSILIICGHIVSVVAGASYSDIVVKIQNNETGYKEVKEWKKIYDNVYVPVVVETDIGIIYYEYDEDNILSSKSDDCGNVISYQFEEYDEGNYRLVCESRNGVNVLYKYEDVYDDEHVTSFIYENKEYYYVYEEGVIKEIMQSGRTVAMYNYDKYMNIESIDVMDNQYSGIVNSIRGYSVMYDDNTSWFYRNGRFYDEKDGFVNNYEELVQDTYIGEIAIPYVMTAQTYAMVINTKVQADLNEINNLSGFGIPIGSYVSNGDWVNSLKTTGKYKEIEIIARTIYGEYTSSTGITTQSQGDFNAQRLAVMWIIQNRTDSSQFPNKPLSVVQQSGQFYSLTGTSDDTEQARKPNSLYDGWTNAILLACYLYEINSMSFGTCTKAQVLNLAAGHPAGISNQLYFASIGTWNAGYTASEGTFKDSNGNVSKVCDIALNVGNITGLKASYNVFFNKK